MHTVQELAAALPILPDSKKSFAASLIEQSGRRGLSEKQLFWVNKLVADARSPTPAPAAVNVGNLSGITALFDRAKQHLKSPAIVMGVPAAAGMLVRINVAGAQAKFPGSLNVTSGEKSAMGERREWYGRVQRDGSYEPSAKAGASATAITARLIEFAADPARVASEHGRLTGRCCFCNLALSDERSTAVGYGKTCAAHYGLPWGELE
jgi:hypothetical protein